MTNANAAALGATSAGSTSGGRDLSGAISKLYLKALEIQRASSADAMALVRAMWKWVCALMDRIARALGLKSNLPQQLSDDQIRGEAPTIVGADAPPGDGVLAQVSDPGVRAETASDAMRAEGERLLDHLSATVSNASLLSSPESAHDFVRYQARKLGEYRGVFLQHAGDLEVQIDAKCGEIAAAVGTTPAVIRAQIEAGHDHGLYDKDGSLAEMLAQHRKAKLAAGRVELAAISLVDACGRAGALQGLRAFAVEEFSRVMPGVLVDRPAPPRGDVADAMGEVLATTQREDLDHVEADAPVAPVSERRVAPQDDGALRSVLTESLARDVLSTKTSLESPEGRQSATGVGVPSLRLAGAGATSLEEPGASDELKSEALSSPFAAASFSELSALARRRQESNPREWRDLPVDR